MRRDKPEPVTGAIYWGGITLLRNLLAEGADPNEISGSGDWASAVLSSAVHKGSLEIIQCLLDHGADPDCERSSGGTPIITAQRQSRDIMEALFWQAPIRTRPPRNGTRSALMVARAMARWTRCAG
jgi:ankyrin repeat protein